MSEAPGRYSYDGLERILHEKARLGIMTSLVAQHDGLVFAELKQVCTLTDGNLNLHMKVLEKNGYVAVRKEFVRRRPRTTYQVTVRGRKEFASYVTQIEAILGSLPPGGSGGSSGAAKK